MDLSEEEKLFIIKMMKNIQISPVSDDAENIVLLCKSIQEKIWGNNDE